MAYAITFTFENGDVGEAQYWAVNAKLGIDRDGNGDWPKGLIIHTGGPLPEGWIVSEVWESKADQEAWMANQLGPALGQVGVPAPTRLYETQPVQVHLS